MLQAGTPPIQEIPEACLAPENTMILQVCFPAINQNL